MCGIFGYFSFTDAVKINNLKLRLRRMANAQSHRGPDYYDQYFGENFAIGMNRLAVYDNNSYPVPYVRQNSVTAFNGEAYSINDVDIGYIAQTEGDGGVVADLLDQNLNNPQNVISSINGMFATATISKNGDRLILTRDRAGEKPIYFYESKFYIIFASEIKSLLAFFLDESEYPKYRHTSDFYYLEGYVNHETPFEGVFSIKPGYIIDIRRDGKKYELEYWHLQHKSFDFSEPESEGEVIENFGYLLKDSIRLRRLNTSTLVTSLLSGGVDSTIVTSIGMPEIAFTGEYENEGFSEGLIPTTMCKYNNIQHEVVNPSKSDFEKYIDEVIWYSDTPVTWTAFNLYMMFKEVSKTGSRVCLTGEGSDEIFNGYARHTLYLNAWNILDTPLWPQYKELIYNFQSDPVSSYLNLTARSSIKSSYSENLYKSIYEGRKNLSSFISAVDFYTSMQILLQMADRMSMRFGVESRSPFLDHRILEFGMKIPPSLKTKNSISKFIVRKFGESLDNGVNYFSVEKKGFGVPFNSWYGDSGYSRGSYFNLTIKKHAELYENFSKFNRALSIYSKE